MKLEKKWLWVLIGCAAAVVVGTALTLGLVFGLRKDKVSQKLASEPWTLQGKTQTFVMGDKFETNGLVLTCVQDGVRFEKQVSLDMVLLPTQGLDKSSGLNKNAIFLEAGTKKVEILAFDQTFVVEVEVLEDKIVELIIPPEYVVEIVESSPVSAASGNCIVYAKTQRGRIVRLDSEMFFVENIIDQANTSVVDSVNGVVFKTNKTVYAQNIEIVIRYDFVEGLNLPIVGEEIEVRLPARMVDNNVKAIDANWGSQTLYRSVATRSDLAELVATSNIELVLANGQTARAHFSDGEFLFELVEYQTGKFGYAFAVDGNGKPMVFEGNNKKSAFVLDLGLAQRQVFAPFGTDYEIVDLMPEDNAQKVAETADGRPVFVPKQTANLAFFGEHQPWQQFSIVVEFESRTGEVFVFETEAQNVLVEDVETLTKVESDQTAKYYSVISGGEEYFVSKSDFDLLVLGKTLEHIYFNNFGFADQVEVFEANGYFYEDEARTKLLTVANVTSIEAYFEGNTMFAFACERPSTNDLQLMQGGGRVVVDAIGEQIETLELVQNKFLSKVTVSGEFLIRSRVATIEIEDNQVVGIESFGAGKPYYLGERLDLEGTGFVLTLENGDNVTLELDKTCVVFEKTENWSDGDFEMAVAGRENGLFEFSGNYFAKNASDASQLVLAYVGHLSGEQKATCNTTFVFKADPIVSANILGEKYVVSGDQDQFVQYILQENIESVELESGRQFSRFAVAFDQNFVFDPQVLTLVAIKDTSEKATDAQFVNLDLVLGAFDTAQTGNEGAGGKQTLVVAWLQSGNIRDDNGLVNTAYFGAYNGPAGLVYAGDRFNLSGFELGTGALGLQLAGLEIEIFDESGANVETILAETFFATPLERTLAQTGKFSAVAKSGNTVVAAMFFDIEQNYVQDNIVVFVDNTSHRPWANGQQISVTQFVDSEIEVTLASGKVMRSNPLSRNDLREKVLDLASTQYAPSQKQTKNLLFAYEDDWSRIEFESAITFFVWVATPDQLAMNTSEAFVPQTFLEDHKRGADSAYYQQHETVKYASLQKYLDIETSLNSAIDRLELDLGFDIEPWLCEVKQDAEGWYVQILGNKYYVEEDYLEVRGQDTFARIVVGNRQVFVKQNKAYDGTGKKYENLDPVRFSIFAGNAIGNLSLVKDNIYVGTLEEEIFVAAQNVGGTHAYVKIVATFSDGVGVQLSDEVVLFLPTVPVVENVSIGGKIIENQLLALGTNLTHSEKVELGAGDYRATNQMPGISIDFVIAGERQKLVLDTYDAQKFFALDFVSTSTENEASYVSGGKAVRLNEGDSVYLRFVFAGIEFGIETRLLDDHVISCDFETLSILENASLFDGTLATTVSNLAFASGKANIDSVVFDDSGVFDAIGTSGDFELVLIVKKNGQVWKVMQAKDWNIASLFGIDSADFDTQSKAHLSRIFGFEAEFGKDAVSFELSAQPAKTDISSLATEFGNESFDFVARTTLQVNADTLSAVDVSAVRKTYYATTSVLDFVDALSIENMKFVFDSGFEFVADANQNTLTRYLVLDDDGIEFVSFVLSGHTVLQRVVVAKQQTNTSGLVVCATDFVADGRDAYLPSYALPVSGERQIEIEFETSGKAVKVEFAIEFVEPVVKSVAVVWSTGHAFTVGQVISVVDLAKMILSATAKVESPEDPNVVVDAAAEKFALKLEFGTYANYEVILDGTAIKITGSGFALGQIDWTI